MIYSILYAVLAALALGILVFIHELGHYFIARREKMKVEAFSIGFGKPLLKWKRGDVVWQFCWIPFGGYVKIAGMERKGSLEPYQIHGGFYEKKPLARIKVALAGPLANIALAFVLFSLIWVTGGREKMFSECTHLLGWVNPDSDLYQKEGVRPGDEITSYGDKPFVGFQQMTYSALLEKGPQELKGEKIEYALDKKIPFSVPIDLGAHLRGLDKVSSLMNLLSPASYLIYSHENGLLTEDSPMLGSGIEDQDRVLWVDGDLIFSRKQLTSAINRSTALFTVLREGKVFLTRLPRLQIGDLRLNPLEKAELQDVSYALGMQLPLAQLSFIPYMVTEECFVISAMPYIDEQAVEQKSLLASGNPWEMPLMPGDQILAVDGLKVSTFSQLFTCLQKKRVQMIVLRQGNYDPVLCKQADQEFMQGVSFEGLNHLIASIGVGERGKAAGNLVLLNPIEPKPRYAFPLAQSLKNRLVEAVVSQKKKEGMESRSTSLKALQEQEKQLMLGIALQDRMVYYNPTPFFLIQASFQEAWQTFHALITGYLSPKYMSGPVGIVQAIHHGWTYGIKEALFWIALISVNLGILNLLPIPVLDGGHICFALYEMVTGKRIKAKTMERLIIPFIVLLVGLFIYLTYQDLLRIISQFFN